MAQASRGGILHFLSHTEHFLGEYSHFVYPDGSYAPTMPKLPPRVYNALLFPK